MSKDFCLILLVLMALLLPGSLVSQGVSNDRSDFPILSGPYLGQTPPPGSTPEIFAPGIISTKESEGCSAFSRDGKWFIFKRFSKTLPDIYEMEEINGQWTKPRIIPFQGEYRTGDYTLSPDGKTLYFASNRPLTAGAQPSGVNANIWKIERNDTGWSEPQPLGPEINTEMHESYPSVTNDGTLYFFRRKSDDNQGEMADIYRSRLVKGKYTKPEILGASINTETHEWDPFIAPDESYLIFCSMKSGGYGKDDLYITFRTGDDWTEPVNMGATINSPESENRPYVTPDGKFFFFTSTRNTPAPGENNHAWIRDYGQCGGRDIYWVDAKILDTFRPTAFPEPPPRGKYLGQEPPSLTPTVFARGIVSTHYKELNASFSPDGNELFFSKHLIHSPDKRYVIMHMKQVNGQWTKPEVAPFSEQFSNVDPCYSPDGRRLFFVSDRPVPGIEGLTRHEIWIVDKTADGWSEPYHAGPQVSSPGSEVHAVLTLNDTIYFSTEGMGGVGHKDIFCARFEKGQIVEPRNLGEAINSLFMESDCLVDPRENFLIFCSNRLGGFGSGDLYISFHKKDGTWTNAQNMGNVINSSEFEYAPMLSPDQKYLFFSRVGKAQEGFGDVYWIDAGIIETFKPKDI